MRPGPLAALLGAAAAVAAAGEVALAPCPPPAETVLAAPPWEVWRDLRLLARLEGGDRVAMSSSHSPEGSRFDRHGPDTSRFLRTEGGEGVIFEDSGPGAITRIWVTTGEEAVSRPIPPGIRVRIRLDGAAEPAVDAPLADLFSGRLPPFVPPLVSDRERSSGGFVSYVPISYRSSCTVSLVGAEREMLWYQVTARKVAGAERVTTFDPAAPPAGWAALLGSADPDPWPDTAQPVSSGTVSLRPGDRRRLLRLEGPDLITGLLLSVPATAWRELRLELRFDGQKRVDLALADLFAVGRAGAPATRSLLVGAYPGGELYCYFPMPFQREAVAELRWPASRLPAPPVEVRYAVRRAACPPLPGSVPFAAVLSTASRAGELSLVDVAGRGRWVGLFAELGARRGRTREYLEGDERVFVDGHRQPALHGTGVEDFFGGGFYFRVDGLEPRPFSLPLHGLAYDVDEGDGRSATGMYRLLLTDAVGFSRGLEVRLEAGPTGELPVRLRSVAYLYLERKPR